MAGVAEPWKLNEVKSAEEACTLIGKPEYAPGVTYSRVFAEEDGRGAKEAAAFEALVKACGEGQASSVRAICWFLYWGSYTGNTLVRARQLRFTFLHSRCLSSWPLSHPKRFCLPLQNGILGMKPGKPTSLPFKLLMLLFYGPLFLEIALVSKIVSVAPVVPSVIGSGFGAILSINAGIWFVPVGLVATLCGAPSCRQQIKAHRD
jgi:hypothetical protein